MCWRHLGAFCIAGVALAVRPDPASAEPMSESATPARPSTVTRNGDSPSSSQRLLASGGSILPGVLLHGAGSWLRGEEDTALELITLEGIGLGLFFGGGTTIVLSGAARSLIGPAVATTAIGAGLFATSWLLDVYQVNMPRDARGTERGRRDGLRSYLEWVTVGSPQFHYGPMLRHGAAAHWQRLAFAYEGAHAPSGRFEQLRVEGGYRLWHAAKATSGSALDVGLATLSSSHLDEDFKTQGLELSTRLRLDSRSLSKRIDGAFTEFQVGVVGRRTTWLATPEAPSATFDETLLIARTGFGVYLGDPWREGGEVQLYYDHRHDGLAEGMLASGLGSGVLGHAGIAGEYFPFSHWGLRLSGEVGSAWVLAAGLSFRSER
jgi:hypothetical protein